MIQVVDASGRVLMEFYVPREVTLNVTQAARLLDSMRSSPEVVRFRYPAISQEWYEFNKFKVLKMDLQREILRTEQAKGDKPDVKQILVCPATPELPNDGMLNFIRIATVFDLKDVSDGTVVQFSHDQISILKLIADNSAVMNLDVKVLVGLPEAEYTSDFDSATWQQQRIAYQPFLTDLRLARDMKKQMDEANMTPYAIERKLVERKSGSVKVHEAEIFTEDRPLADDSDLDDGDAL